LRDEKLLEAFENQSVEEGRQAVVEKFKMTKDSSVRALAMSEARRRMMVRHYYPTNRYGDGAADWNQLVNGFRNGISGTAAIIRSVCDQAIQLLVARAILLSDFKSLEGLAHVTKEAHFSQLETAPIPTREIVAEIIRFHPILIERLPWLPSKETIRLFLLSAKPWLSDHSTTWSSAWKLFTPELMPTLGTSRLTAERKNAVLTLAQEFSDND
jgi:hypothetical protein